MHGGRTAESWQIVYSFASYGGCMALMWLMRCAAFAQVSLIAAHTETVVIAAQWRLVNRDPPHIAPCRPELQP